MSFSYRPASTADQWPAPPSLEGGAQMHVLVVDDHPAVLSSLAYTLRRWGCSVATAGTYSEGMRQAQARPPHMALIDVRLAGAPRGVGLGQVIRERSPGTRVGLMTGWTTPRAARLQAEERVNGGLWLKPIDPDDLRRAIDRVCAGLSPFPRLEEEQ